MLSTTTVNSLAHFAHRAYYNMRCATSDAGVGADSEADLEADAEPAARGKKGQ